MEHESAYMYMYYRMLAACEDAVTCIYQNPEKAINSLIDAMDECETNFKYGAYAKDEAWEAEGNYEAMTTAALSAALHHEVSKEDENEINVPKILAITQALENRGALPSANPPSWEDFVRAHSDYFGATKEKTDQPS